MVSVMKMLANPRWSRPRVAPAGVRRKTGGYRWRSRSAGRKPGGPRPTGSCPKALGAGPRRRPADFANGSAPGDRQGV